MEHHDWMVAKAPGHPIARTARIRHVSVLRCAFLGSGLALVLALVFLPLHLLSVSILSAPLEGGREWSLALARMSGLPVLALVIALEALMGFVFGALGALAFNLVAPMVGGLELEVELESEGAGRHALEAYGEQPVFEGR